MPRAAGCLQEPTPRRPGGGAGEGAGRPLRLQHHESRTAPPAAGGARQLRAAPRCAPPTRRAPVPARPRAGRPGAPAAGPAERRLRRGGPAASEQPEGSGSSALRRVFRRAFTSHRPFRGPAKKRKLSEVIECWVISWAMVTALWVPSRKPKSH